MVYPNNPKGQKSADDSSTDDSDSKIEVNSLRGPESDDFSEERTICSPLYANARDSREIFKPWVNRDERYCSYEDFHGSEDEEGLANLSTSVNSLEYVNGSTVLSSPADEDYIGTASYDLTDFSPDELYSPGDDSHSNDSNAFSQDMPSSSGDEDFTAAEDSTFLSSSSKATRVQTCNSEESPQICSYTESREESNCMNKGRSFMNRRRKSRITLVDTDLALRETAIANERDSLHDNNFRDVSLDSANINSKLIETSGQENHGQWIHNGMNDEITIPQSTENPSPSNKNELKRNQLASHDGEMQDRRSLKNASKSSVRSDKTVDLIRTFGHRKNKGNTMLKSNVTMEIQNLIPNVENSNKKAEEFSTTSEVSASNHPNSEGNMTIAASDDFSLKESMHTLIFSQTKKKEDTSPIVLMTNNENLADVSPSRQKVLLVRRINDRNNNALKEEAYQRYDTAFADNSGENQKNLDTNSTKTRISSNMPGNMVGHPPINASNQTLRMEKKLVDHDFVASTSTKSKNHYDFIDNSDENLIGKERHKPSTNAGKRSVKPVQCTVLEQRNDPREMRHQCGNESTQKKPSHKKGGVPKKKRSCIEGKCPTQNLSNDKVQNTEDIPLRKISSQSQSLNTAEKMQPKEDESQVSGKTKVYDKKILSEPGNLDIFLGRFVRKIEYPALAEDQSNKERHADSADKESKNLKTSMTTLNISQSQRKDFTTDLFMKKTEQTDITLSRFIRKVHGRKSNFFKGDLKKTDDGVNTSNFTDNPRKISLINSEETKLSSFKSNSSESGRLNDMRNKVVLAEKRQVNKILSSNTSESQSHKNFANKTDKKLTVHNENNTDRHHPTCKAKENTQTGPAGDKGAFLDQRNINGKIFSQSDSFHEDGDIYTEENVIEDTSAQFRSVNEAKNKHIKELEDKEYGVLPNFSNVFFFVEQGIEVQHVQYFDPTEMRHQPGKENNIEMKPWHEDKGDVQKELQSLTGKKVLVPSQNESDRIAQKNVIDVLVTGRPPHTTQNIKATEVGIHRRNQSFRPPRNLNKEQQYPALLLENQSSKEPNLSMKKKKEQADITLGRFIRKIHGRKNNFFKGEARTLYDKVTTNICMNYPNKNLLTNKEEIRLSSCKPNNSKGREAVQTEKILVNHPLTYVNPASSKPSEIQSHNSFTSKIVNKIILRQESNVFKHHPMSAVSKDLASLVGNQGADQLHNDVNKVPHQRGEEHPQTGPMGAKGTSLEDKLSIIKGKVSPQSDHFNDDKNIYITEDVMEDTSAHSHSLIDARNIPMKECGSQESGIASNISDGIKFKEQGIEVQTIGGNLVITRAGSFPLEIFHGQEATLKNTGIKEGIRNGSSLSKSSGSDILPKAIADVAPMKSGVDRRNSKKAGVLARKPISPLGATVNKEASSILEKGHPHTNLGSRSVNCKIDLNVHSFGSYKLKVDQEAVKEAENKKRIGSQNQRLDLGLLVSSGELRHPNQVAHSITSSNVKADDVESSVTKIEQLTGKLVNKHKEETFEVANERWITTLFWKKCQPSDLGLSSEMRCDNIKVHCCGSPGISVVQDEKNDTTTSEKGTNNWVENLTESFGTAKEKWFTSRFISKQQPADPGTLSGEMQKGNTLSCPDRLSSRNLELNANENEARHIEDQTPASVATNQTISKDKIISSSVGERVISSGTKVVTKLPRRKSLCGVAGHREGKASGSVVNRTDSQASINSLLLDVDAVDGRVNSSATKIVTKLPRSKVLSGRMHRGNTITCRNRLSSRNLERNASNGAAGHMEDKASVASSATKNVSKLPIRKVLTQNLPEVGPTQKESSEEEMKEIYQRHPPVYAASSLRKEKGSRTAKNNYVVRFESSLVRDEFEIPDNNLESVLVPEKHRQPVSSSATACVDGVRSKSPIVLNSITQIRQNELGSLKASQDFQAARCCDSANGFDVWSFVSKSLGADPCFTKLSSTLSHDSCTREDETIIVHGEEEGQEMTICDLNLTSESVDRTKTASPSSKSKGRIFGYIFSKEQDVGSSRKSSKSATRQKLSVRAVQSKHQTT